MKWLLFKLLGNFISHDHKVMRITDRYEKDGYYAYTVIMDCHVQPVKVLVLKSPIMEGQVFDPHFTNRDVVARFAPSLTGFTHAKELVNTITGGTP
jgi:hypothetical protein